MPRLTDARATPGREQILEAARACLQDHGLEAVSMEMIIARSDLSTPQVAGADSSPLVQACAERCT